MCVFDGGYFCLVMNSNIVLSWEHYYFMERSSSAVDCQTINRESQGSTPLCYYVFGRLFIFVLSTTPQFNELHKRVLGYRQRLKCESIVFVQYTALVNAYQKSRNGVGINRMNRYARGKCKTI